MLHSYILDTLVIQFSPSLSVSSPHLHSHNSFQTLPTLVIFQHVSSTFSLFFSCVYQEIYSYVTIKWRVKLGKYGEGINGVVGPNVNNVTFSTCRWMTCLLLKGGVGKHRRGLFSELVILLMLFICACVLLLYKCHYLYDIKSQKIYFTYEKSFT